MSDTDNPSLEAVAAMSALPADDPHVADRIAGIMEMIRKGLREPIAEDAGTASTVSRSVDEAEDVPHESDPVRRVMEFAPKSESDLIMVPFGITGGKDS